MGCRSDPELIILYMWLLVPYPNCYELSKCDEGFIVPACRLIKQDVITFLTA